MYTPQAGIFALGTSSHAYLEFDTLDAKKSREFASTISAIREPRTTTGGVISSSVFGLSSGAILFPMTLLRTSRALTMRSGAQKDSLCRHATRCAGMAL